MPRVGRFIGSVLLATTILVPMVSAGCAARVRYYDAEYRDYHRWDAREEGAYHRYWDERHERYRDWRELNEQEQRDYWNWRHGHVDRN